MEREEIVKTLYNLVSSLKLIPQKVEKAKGLEEMFKYAFKNNKLRVFPGNVCGFDADDFSTLLEQEEVDFLRERVLSRISKHREHANCQQKEIITEIRKLLDQLEEIEI